MHSTRTVPDAQIIDWFPVGLHINSNSIMHVTDIPNVYTHAHPEQSKPSTHICTRRLKQQARQTRRGGARPPKSRTARPWSAFEEPSKAPQSYAVGNENSAHPSARVDPPFVVSGMSHAMSCTDPGHVCYAAVENGCLVWDVTANGRMGWPGDGETRLFQVFKWCRCGEVE